MEQHLTLLGIIHIVWSSIGIIASLIVFLVVAGGGALSGDIDVMTVTTTIGTLVSSFLLVVSLPGLIGGIGILYRFRWARILLLVVGFLYLVNIPFGTMLGIYTVWVLLSEDTKRLFGENIRYGE